MPHLDYLTYLSQVFWFLFFFWISYFLFFFVFFPKLYYSFRIRKVKLDFLFDKYVSSEYRIHFYNFFFKDYSDRFRVIMLSYLKLLRKKYSISLAKSYDKVKLITFFVNLFLNEIFYFYWSKGVSLNFSVFLNSIFFSDWGKLRSLNRLNKIYIFKN